MAKHPAAFFLRYLIVADPEVTDASLQKRLEDWGFLTADPSYFPQLRTEVMARPDGFDIANRAHRPSVRFLRNLQIYEMAHPDEAMQDALHILEDPDKRMAVEQILLARLDLKITAQKVNTKRNWHLTEDILSLYRHYFWNVPSMTFDEWGRYMYNRTALYEQYMSLLLASPRLAFYHLRLDQTIESKRMIQRAQEIAYFALEEIAQKPGVPVDKVKSISLLGRLIIDAHAALSTSDMALKDVLKQFEHWRMEHPQIMPPSIKDIAPGGNFTGSGADDPKAKKNGHIN